MERRNEDEKWLLLVWSGGERSELTQRVASNDSDSDG